MIYARVIIHFRKENSRYVSTKEKFVKCELPSNTLTKHKCLKYISLKIDGSHSFIISEKEVADIYYRQYKSQNAYAYLDVATVKVSVAEELTGKTYFGTTNVVLRRTDVVLRFGQANPKSFKPNVPFQILVGCNV